MINPPPSIPYTLAQFHLTEMQLAQHLGVTKHTLQMYARGNLEMPQPVERLFALLVELWNHYQWPKDPIEMWGSQWEAPTKVTRRERLANDYS